MYKGVHLKNHNINDYYDFTRNARGSFCAMELEKKANFAIKFTNDPLGLYPVLYILNEKYTHNN